MFRYKLVLSYVGTRYGGWQIQKRGVVTVQGLVQDVLARILGDKICLKGAGRTDAGVHALGQVAHFSYSENLSQLALQNGLNSLLPEDVRVSSVELVRPRFHAQHDAVGKWYRYYISLSTQAKPFYSNFSLSYPHAFDKELLCGVLPLFEGEKDFSSFANIRAPGERLQNGVRKIFALKMGEWQHGVYLDFLGSGFLYKMVRNIVGTLLSVIQGKLSPQNVYELFEKKDRKRAGPAVAPQGLFLCEVFYTEVCLGAWSEKRVKMGMMYVAD